MNLHIVPYGVSIAASLLIFVRPELLNYIVATYLVLAGAVGLVAILQ